MAVVETGTPRSASQPRLAHRRRVMEWLMLGVASVAFVFSLAVAVGLISG